MTVFSDAEEWPGEIHSGTMPLHVEQALQIAGAIWMKDRFIRATSSATVKSSLARTRPATLP